MNTLYTMMLVRASVLISERVSVYKIRIKIHLGKCVSYGQVLFGKGCSLRLVPGRVLLIVQKRNRYLLRQGYLLEKVVFV